MNQIDNYSNATFHFKQFLAKYNTIGVDAKMASLVSIIFNEIKDFFFVGFYVVKQDFLEIGPYMSTILATPIIAKGKGVCGTCWEEGKVQVVDDVRECKNYIACDEDTKSEIVLPLIKNGEVIAVLDIDSVEVGRFKEHDIESLKKLLEMI